MGKVVIGSVCDVIQREVEGAKEHSSWHCKYWCGWDGNL